MPIPMCGMLKNLALELIHENAHNNLTSNSQNNIYLQGLISQLNQVGRLISHSYTKKHNCWSKYIKMTQGHLTNFTRILDFTML